MATRTMQEPARCEAAGRMAVGWGVAAEGLERFRLLMAAEGCGVNVARMDLDPVYARECISRAHTSAQDELRAIAVVLFERYGPVAGTPARH